MSFPLIVDGNSYQYPSQGDKANTGWGTQTGNWASAVTSALTKLGLGGTLSPIANAVIDISSTSKGILIPRMTTAQRNAISSPANSLLIFNTDLKVVQYYDLSVAQWISVGAKIPDNVVFSGTLTVNGNITGLGSISATSGLNGATGNFTDTTDATDADNAPLKTLGGMAVKKKLFVGTDLNVGGGLTGTTGNFANTTDATSTTDGALKTAGGVGIAKKLFVGTGILTGNGSNASPSMSLINDPDTGLYHISSGKFGFSSNGTKTGEIGELGFLNETLGSDFRNLLQVQELVTGAYSTGAGIIPTDNTTPQITEGTQYLSVSITPKAINSKLIIETYVHYYIGSSSTRVVTSLFLVGQNDSIGCSLIQIPTDGMGVVDYVKSEVLNTDLMSKTFTTRIGCQTAINVRFNSNTTSGLFNGKLKSFIRVSEYV